MKPMMIITSKKQHQAFLAGQADLRNDIAEQLIEQLSAARAELQQARAEHAAKIAAARAKFNSEAEAMRLEAEVMRREFTEAIAQLNELRLRMFHQWTRTDEMLN
jgi:hypothetical protein